METEFREVKYAGVCSNFTVVFFCFASLGVFLDMFRHGYDTDPSGLRVCRLGFENTPALCILKVSEVTSNRLIQSQLTPRLPHTMHDANWH